MTEGKAIGTDYVLGTQLGRMSCDEADALRGEFQALEQNPDAVMITPLVLEIIAEKRGSNS
jgi:hypothetical protein